MSDPDGGFALLNGDGACADYFLDTVGAQKLFVSVEILLGVGKLYRHRVCRNVRYLSLCYFSDTDEFSALLLSAAYLYENKLAGDRRVVMQGLYLDNVDKLVQLLFYLFKRICAAVRDDGYSLDSLIVGNAYRKAVYVETTAREKSCNSRKNACMVFYQY